MWVHKALVKYRGDNFCVNKYMKIAHFKMNRMSNQTLFFGLIMIMDWYDIITVPPQYQL